ncbi:MAG: type II secretion system protein [Planctomycetota bacterium]
MTADRLTTDRRTTPAPPRRRGGFTLVELLVVIAIIGTLSALVLVVGASAAESGRTAKTKQMITRLHTLVMEHYDTFRDKRVSLDESTVDGDGTYVDEIVSTGVSLAGRRPGEVVALGRLLGSREQMKMEMPERWSDFLVADLSGGLPDPTPVPSDSDGELGGPTYLLSIPPLAQAYRARYEQVWDQTNTETGAPNTVADLVANEGAECLYMIVVLATGTGESRGLFKESDIGDVDGDGAPEFIDAWGNPIQFLRWAPGFRSGLQLNQVDLVQVFEDGEAEAPAAGAERVAEAIRADHDPMDLFRVDGFTADSVRTFTQGNGVVKRLLYDDASPQQPARGFRLVPLIYSAGRDGDSDIDTGRLVDAVGTSVDPYLVFEADINGNTVDGRQVGSPINDDGADESQDNLTNHLIEYERGLR